MFGTDGFLDDDNLKAHVEEIRGRPITVTHPSGDDWTEVSDAERLCKAPVVSVVMITFNHERFMRQALESIVTQKTDFEFECIIGEDCSTDRTREICLEYQRRYPEIIRVIYPRANTFRKYGSQVFNLAEVYSRCRGEFGAMCEGDDFWIDDHKLAKQVKVMREHPDVSFCWTRSKMYFNEEDRFEIVPPERDAKFGVMSGRDFWKKVIYRTLGNINTPGYFWRRIPQVELYNKLAFPAWNIMVGDVPLPMTAGTLGNVYRMEDVASVYRVHGTSVCHITGHNVALDNIAISAYFSYLLWHMPLCRFPFMQKAFRHRLQDAFKQSCLSDRMKGFLAIIKASPFRLVVLNPFNWIYLLAAPIGRHIRIFDDFVDQGIVLFLKLRIPDIPRRIKRAVTRG